MSTIKAIAIWFRYEDAIYSDGVDEFDNPLGPGHMEVHLREFTVDKVTPKGVWLCGFMLRRFVLRGARKQFACPTLEGALASFQARKRKQHQIYTRKAAMADEAGMLAEQHAADLSSELGNKKLHDWSVR